jgi:hypothetical protein
MKYQSGSFCQYFVPQKFHIYTYFLWSINESGFFVFVQWYKLLCLRVYTVFFYRAAKKEWHMSIVKTFTSSLWYANSTFFGDMLYSYVAYEKLRADIRSISDSGIIHFGQETINTTNTCQLAAVIVCRRLLRLKVFDFRLCGPAWMKVVLWSGSRSGSDFPL